MHTELCPKAVLDLNFKRFIMFVNLKITQTHIPHAHRHTHIYENLIQNLMNKMKFQSTDLKFRVKTLVNTDILKLYMECKADWTYVCLFYLQSLAYSNKL